MKSYTPTPATAAAPAPRAASFAQRMARGMAVAALFASSLLPAATASAEGGTVFHTVQPGENLFRIAIRYGVSQQAILNASGLTNPHYIRIGQVLAVPAGGDQAALVPPAAVPAVAAAESNKAAQTPADSGGVRLHNVQQGENLFRIALRYGVSVTALVRANSLPSADVVAAGQTLVIPDSSGAGGGVSGLPEGSGTALQPLISTPTGFPTVAASDNVEGIDFGPAPWFRLTHYCLTGTMASGRGVYLGAVAADQSVFPLGTRLVVEGYGFFTVEDRFAWDGREARLDVWVPTCWEAVQRGVQYRRVFVVLPR